MTRFNRDFQFDAQILGGVVTVKPPLRIQFSADKSINGGLNKIQIKLFNLNEKNRLALAKDADEFNKIIPIQLYVGYKGSLELVFKGTIHTCSNSRKGADMVTTIEGLDGGYDFLNAFTSRTVKTSETVVDVCLEDMSRIGRGSITGRHPVSRPKVLVGNTAKLIEDTIGPDETWYIEDELLYIQKDNEVVGRFIPVVNAKTGLINTPTRENQKVTFETVMNPTVKIGRRVQLESITAPYLNGIYKIETMNYSGDNFGDDWRQSCSGYLANGAIELV